MKKFDEALKTRREEVRRHRSRALEMQRKRMKQEKRKNFVLFIGLLIGFILSIILLMQFNQKFTNDCTEIHSKTYCEKGL